MPDTEKKEVAVRIKSVQELIQELENLGSGDFVYRGQADVEWELRSGAYRRLRYTTDQKKEIASDQNKEITSDEVLEYVQELINNAKALGLDFHGMQNGDCCDLKILAELQHYGAATNLLDFSRNVLIALWMVCSEQPDKDGKIFILNLLEDNLDLLDVQEAKDCDIKAIMKKEKITFWTPDKFVSRIQAQASVFVIAPEEAQIQTKEFIIEKGRKKDILKDLANHFAITEVQVYPDLPGFARANRAEMPTLDRETSYYLMWGQKYEKAGNKEKARAFYNKAKRIDSENPYVYFRIAYLLDSNTDDDSRKEAILNYSDAIKLNPKFSGAYNNRGLLRDQMGDSSGALEDYEKAIELNPKDSEAYYNRGNCKKKLKDFNDALEDYNKAIELNPKYSEAYNNRGNLKAKTGDDKGALEDYNKAIELNPKDSDVYNNRGNLKAKTGDDKGALEDYNKAIELNPKDSDVYNNRGYNKTKTGDFKGALEDYNKAIELNPKNSVAYYNKAFFLNQQRKYEDAMEAITRYRELDPEDPAGTKLWEKIQAAIKKK